MSHLPTAFDPGERSRLLARLRAEIPRFPRQMQIAAKYMLDHPDAFGLDPIRVSAAQAGVSAYTLVSLARRLGFDGFDALRAPFRASLTRHATPEPDWLSSRAGSGEAGRVFAEAATATLGNVEAALAGVNPADLALAAACLHGARHVHVLGMRASFGLAHLFHYVARMALADINLLPRPATSPIDDLADAGPGDVLLAIGFAPWSRETVAACEHMRVRGGGLILLADSALIAPGLEADHAFIAPTQSSHLFGAVSALSALTELLLAAVIHAGGEDTRARIEDYDRLRREHDAYWSPRRQNKGYPVS